QPARHARARRPGGHDPARGDLRPARHAHPAAARQRELREALPGGARQRPARAPGGAVIRSLAAVAGASIATLGLAGTLAAQQPAPQEPPPAAPAGQVQPQFRAGVPVVSLNVTVTDKSGRYLEGLDEAEFSVFEDGVKQDLILFSGTQLPTALALLIDTSASM